jgi:hypothetical protein
MKFQSPKGTRDFYPAEMAVRRRIEAAWRDASVAFGFDEIDGPTFEHLELYTAKSGEGIVNELFSFRRAGGSDDYALRPEFTPTLARMAAARAAQLPVPIKWFAVPNFFRAERPQRGRLREFYQWNVDLLGAEGPAIDAEVIGVAVAALARLGLKHTDVRVKISHRVAAAKLVRALGVAEESVAGAFELLDRRDKMPPEEFTKRAAALGLAGDALARFESAVRTRVQVGEDLGVLASAAGIAAEELGELAALRDASSTSASFAAWRTTRARSSRSTKPPAASAPLRAAVVTTGWWNSSVAPRRRRWVSAWVTWCLAWCLPIGGSCRRTATNSSRARMRSWSRRANPRRMRNSRASSRGCAPTDSTCVTATRPRATWASCSRMHRSSARGLR